MHPHVRTMFHMFSNDEKPLIQDVSNMCMQCKGGQLVTILDIQAFIPRWKGSQGTPPERARPNKLSCMKTDSWSPPGSGTVASSLPVHKFA